MNILMFGRGVIATQYGWAFEKAGHSVEFYVRPGKKATLGDTISLSLLDARTKTKGVSVNETWTVRMRETIPADHNYDLIVVSVQHYQFSEVAAFLAPLVGKATVLILTNFWKDPQQEASALPAEQLAWGFPQAGGGFDSDGVLRGALFADVHVGTFGTDPTDRELAVRNLFSNSGFKLHEHRDFRGWLWIHFAINAGLFAEALSAGSVEQVFTSQTHLTNAVRTVRETLLVVEKRGINLANNASDIALYRRPAWLASLLIWFVLKISPPLRLFLFSFNNSEEAKSYCRGLLADAHQLNISVSRLEATKRYLE